MCLYVCVYVHVSYLANQNAIISFNNSYRLYIPYIHTCIFTYVRLKCLLGTVWLGRLLVNSWKIVGFPTITKIWAISTWGCPLRPQAITWKWSTWQLMINNCFKKLKFSNFHILVYVTLAVFLNGVLRVLMFYDKLDSHLFYFLLLH